MKKHIFTILVVIAMVMNFSLFSVSATGDSVESPYPDYAEGLNDIDTNPLIMPYASGLISTCNLYFSVSGKTLTIQGHTTASDVMAQVGIKSLKVERNSNGTSWTTEKNLGDFLKTDGITYALYTTTTVTGGYYYRITCTHYAKEQGWLFPGSQSYDNCTSYVWVS